MSPAQKEILLHFAPAWSRRVAVSSAMGPEHVALREASFEIRSLDASGALSLDAMYVVGMDAPRQPREAVPLFAKLDGGGIAILETRPGRSIKRALKQVAAGNGLELIFFGAPGSLPLRLDRATGRGGAHLAVFRKPFFANRDTERKALTIALPAAAVAEPDGRQRLLAWRDFLHGARLTASAELLLINDDPDLHTTIQEFVGAELRELRRDDALRILNHYRPFGPARVVQSAAAFARGDYVFWEQRPAGATASTARFAMRCDEVFACLTAMWGLEERRGGLPPYRACAIRPAPLWSHAKSGRVLKLREAAAPPDSALWNRRALANIVAAKTKSVGARLRRPGGAAGLAQVVARCNVRVYDPANDDELRLSGTPRLPAPPGD